MINKKNAAIMLEWSIGSGMDISEKKDFLKTMKHSLNVGELKAMLSGFTDDTPVKIVFMDESVDGGSIGYPVSAGECTDGINSFISIDVLGRIDLINEYVEFVENDYEFPIKKL